MPMDSATVAAPSHLAALLPSLAAGAAAGARLAHDRRLSPLWDALADAPGLTLASAHRPGPGRQHELMLETDAGTAVLAIATSDDAALSLAADACANPRMRALVVDALFADVVARLAARALPGARVVALSHITTPAVPAGGWCALRRDGRELMRIAVQSLAPGVIDALHGARSAPAAPTAWREQLHLAASVVVAERRLPIALLRSLELGDVLVFPGAGATLDGAAAALCLRSGAGRPYGAPGYIEANAFTLLEGLCMMDTDTLPELLPPAAADSLGELEVPLRFEIETVAITVAELEAIEPGYVIEFGTPVAQARLRLVSCGMVIGEADLIAVGNHLGARITHLVPRHESQRQPG